MLAPSFATGLWEALSHDLQYIWPQMLLMVSGLLMLWPLDSWLLPWTKAEKHKWAIPTMAILLVSLLISLYTPKDLFVGDTLFAGSIGRTDFPGGDHAALIRSIREKLFPLGDDVRFVPGHGPTSTFGRERRDNPYVADRLFERATAKG